MRFEEWLEAGGHAGYAYSYPHKSAYRRLSPAVPLKDVWGLEDRSALSLYVHIPFCEMRCGFCNLFTAARPQSDLVEETLDSILEQSKILASMLAPLTVGHAAFGGGTPSFLSARRLASLFDHLSQDWGIDWSAVPVSVEVTPETATSEKLSLLKERGVDRISMGVQSFDSEVLKSLGRPDRSNAVRQGCSAVKRLGFESLNLDLIYGAPGQTREQWKQTLDSTLRLDPEEVYLYPLYVRSLTGLEKRGAAAESRVDLYRRGRELLLERGFEQLSMRHFRRPECFATDSGSPTEYSCQDDGMIGLGPGARSYSQALHYSSEFAVSRTNVLQIIRSFCSRTREDHSTADYGIWLTPEDQKRRFVIKSLLNAEGLDTTRYEQRFGSGPLADLPQLSELEEGGFTRNRGALVALTERGYEASDAIGPWLYSEEVRRRMKGFHLV